MLDNAALRRNSTSAKGMSGCHQQKRSTMKLKGLLMACLVSALTSAFAADAELHQETSTEEQRFKGVFPPDVKTIAMISPASYPGSALHKRGIELLKASGYTI